MAGVWEALEAAIHAAAPLIEIHTGFSLDAPDWAQSAKVTGPTILLSFEADEPQGFREGARASKFVENYAVYFRAGPVSAAQMQEVVYPQYVAMRNALNGLTVKDLEGKDRTILLQPGRVERIGGIGLATLSFRVE
jgi:hypothetical protein